MKNTRLRSIGAILVGITVGAILSIATDQILERNAIIIREPFDANPAMVIILIICYRTLYNITGAYLTARLAPAKPILHALLLGTLGLIVGVIGTIAMWNIPPHWYPIALDILAIPSALLGGILAIRKNIHQPLNQMS